MTTENVNNAQTSTPVTIDQVGAEVIGARTVGNFNKGETRTDVSQHWFNRPDDQKFLSLSDLYRFTHRAFHESHSDVVASRDVTVSAPSEVNSKADMERLVLINPANGRPSTMTNWTFGQLAGLAHAPSKYLKTLPSWTTSSMPARASLPVSLTPN